jgi:hypothetical protein
MALTGTNVLPPFTGSASTGHDLTMMGGDGLVGWGLANLAYARILATNITPLSGYSGILGDVISPFRPPFLLQGQPDLATSNGPALRLGLHGDDDVFYSRPAPHQDASIRATLALVLDAP